MPTAGSLADRIDALAAALRAADVPPDRVAAILGSAAAATMHALVLGAVLDENRLAVRPPTAPEETADAEPAPLRAAA
jgi:hypothetical protein